MSPRLVGRRISSGDCDEDAVTGTILEVEGSGDDARILVAWDGAHQTWESAAADHVWEFEDDEGTGR